MKMKTLTPAILHELVERIDVYQTQGRGKNRTQRIVIHYNFIGVLDLPQVEEYPESVVKGYNVEVAQKRAVYRQRSFLRLKKAPVRRGGDVRKLFKRGSA